MLDSLEAEGFQAGLLSPKQEVVARDSLNWGTGRGRAGDPCAIPGSLGDCCAPAKLVESGNLLRAAQALWCKLLGSEHPEVAVSLDNPTLVLRKQ